MPNIYRFIGLYNLHVKFNRICSVPFDFENIFSYLEPQLTNSRNSHFGLIFPGFYQKQQQNVDLFYLSICMLQLNEYMPNRLILGIYIDI